MAAGFSKTGKGGAGNGATAAGRRRWCTWCSDGDRPIGRVVAPAGEPMLWAGGGNGAPARGTRSCARPRPALKRFRSARGSGRRLLHAPSLPGGSNMRRSWYSAPRRSSPSSPPAAATAPPRRQPPCRRHRTGDHPGGSRSSASHLRRRLDAGRRAGDAWATCAATPTSRGSSRRLGLKPGGRQRRVPAAGAADQLRPRHRPGPRFAPARARWPRSRTSTPTSRRSRCRSDRSTAPSSSTSARRRTRPRGPRARRCRARWSCSGARAMANPSARPTSAPQGPFGPGGGDRGHRDRSADRPVRRLPPRAARRGQGRLTSRRPA